MRKLFINEYLDEKDILLTIPDPDSIDMEEKMADKPVFTGDTCPMGIKTSQLLDEVVGGKDFQVFFGHHMHNFWMGSIEKDVTLELKKILLDDL